MSTKQSALDKLIFRVNEMDITEQLNWLGDAIMPVEARRELEQLRARVRELELQLTHYEIGADEQIQRELDAALNGGEE
jgi:BMFP domain-containing protein YqiC